MHLPLSARWLLLALISTALARPQDNNQQQDSKWPGLENVSSSSGRQSKDIVPDRTIRERDTLLGEVSLSAILDQRTPPKLKEQQRKSTQKEEEGHKGVAVPVPPDQIEETLKKHETRTSKKPPTTPSGTTTKDGISTWVYLSGSESTTMKSKKKTPSTEALQITTPMSTITSTAATTAVSETESRVNQKNSTQTDKKKNKRRRRPTGVKPTTDVAEKPKPPQKPLSTQIYNYLAREVMPSVGVGLLGLVVTAGLAGLFMYPFGGGIARRTYEVDSHEAAVHYANPDDKHGHREEEVFGQVLAGMSNNPAYAYDEAQTGTQYKVAADQQTDGYHGYYPAREKYRHYTSTTFRYPTTTTFRYPSTTTKYPNVDEISITEATEPPPARHRYPDTYPTRRYSEPIYQTAESGQEVGQHAIETTTKDSYLPENYEIRRYSNEMRSFMNPRDLKISREKRSIENNENELDSDLDKIMTTSTTTTTISPTTTNEITTITTEDTPTTTETPITTTALSDLENEINTNPSISSTSTIQSISSSSSSIINGINSSTTSATATSSSTTIKPPFLTTFKDKDKENLQYQNNPESFSLLSLFRRVAAFKLRLGLDMLKSTSRAFYRYLDDVERRIDRRSDKNKQR